MKHLATALLVLSICCLPGATALGDLANSMTVGTWAQLSATGLTSSLITDNGGFNILEYSNKMEWWPGGKNMMGGSQELVWDASGLPGGIYLLKVFAGREMVSRKLLFQK